jgi:hypothetical protein
LVRYFRFGAPGFLDDAPAVLLPNGHVQCVVGGLYAGWAGFPISFFEFEARDPDRAERLAGEHRRKTLALRKEMVREQLRHPRPERSIATAAGIG